MVGDPVPYPGDILMNSLILFGRRLSRLCPGMEGLAGGHPEIHEGVTGMIRTENLSKIYPMGQSR